MGRMIDVAFTPPRRADLAAVAVGSLQCAMSASGFRDRRFDLLGIAIIGIASGIGCGFLRDITVGVPLAALTTS